MLAASAAAVEAIGYRIGQMSRAVLVGGGGAGFWRDAAANNGITLAFTAVAGIALAAAVFYSTRLSEASSSSKSSPPFSSSSSSSNTSSSSSRIQLRSSLSVVAPSNFSLDSSFSSRGRLKSPWHRRKRKNILSAEQWRNLFTSKGKLQDNGVKFLKKVRTGGVDPSIRAEVWPFLLGVFDLRCSKQDRDVIIAQKRKEYLKLRRQCKQLVKDHSALLRLKGSVERSGKGGSLAEARDSADSNRATAARESHSSKEGLQQNEDANRLTDSSTYQLLGSKRIKDSNVASGSDSTDSDSSNDVEVSQTLNLSQSTEDNDHDLPFDEGSRPSQKEVQSKLRGREDFATWQRIIRVDAVRANGEWMEYDPVQASVSEAKARRAAEVVGLTGFDHLEPGRVFHAARLVAILEAYALYDHEIGYCQGMSDLLSPLIAVMTEDHEAFWCFVGFMKKARHNFRLDEVGIRRQLNLVSKIIKHKDSHLYSHLEKLQAEDCFFVYRMVVVLFRRELTFEQTLCLWEVMWADQAAVRAGIGKSGWEKIRRRVPPTDDLLLYAIAASVLQRRKQIIEKYCSMDEILRECNSMAGRLDVWKLLDDAHDLVVILQDKIETSL